MTTNDWLGFAALTLLFAVPAVAMAPAEKRGGFAFHVVMVTILTCLALNFVD